MRSLFKFEMTLLNKSLLSLANFKLIRRNFSLNKSLANVANKIKDDKYPSDVTIVEVGPRDGLQNEKVIPK